MAWICTLGIAFIVLVVGFAATPQSDCGNTGCDNGYAVGGMLLSVVLFPIVLVGVVLG